MPTMVAMDPRRGFLVFVVIAFIVNRAVGAFSLSSGL